MKKKLLVLAAAALSLTVAVSGTLAYFTDSGTAHNIITTGGVGIKIVETKEDGTPFENIDGIMPGTSEYKIVTVQNTKEQDAWIRVWVNTAISESGDPITNPTIKCLPLTVGDVNIVEYMLEEENDNLVKLKDSKEWARNWLHGEDGYYYYTEPVKPGESTAALFEKVYFAPEMGNEYQNCTIYIDITAEAIQAKNNVLLDTDGSPIALTAETLSKVWPDGVEILPADNDTEENTEDENTEDKANNDNDTADEGAE